MVSIMYKFFVTFCVLQIYSVVCLVIIEKKENFSIPRRHFKYTMDDLFNIVFPKKTSNDFDLDPCKAGGFLGNHAVSLYNPTLKPVQNFFNFQQEIEKFEQDILDGLQIEEEGLRKYLKKKTKQTASSAISRHYNNPFDSVSLNLAGTNQNNENEMRNKNNKQLGSSRSSRSTNIHEFPEEFPKFKLERKNIVKRKISKLRVARAATARKEKIWDYGVIPYEIDENFGGHHNALFKQAMRHWENFTCIKFVERNRDEHQNYIIFTEKPCGCCSFVGKRGNGGQAISIGRNCDKFGVIVHELGHVVGLWHEHTRPDRDKYVNINRENILSGQEYNFNKLSEDEVNDLGVPYDYNSIMHYARNTFSKGTYLDTIQPVDELGRKRPEIGQRIRLSEGDIAQTNLLYKCPKCGRTYQTNSATFSPPVFQESTSKEEVRCEWRITGTHGEKIVLNITSLDMAKSPDCETDFIEIRDGYWHKSAVLGLFCGRGQFVSVVSTGSRMMITYVSKNPKGHKGFIASYEAICGGDFLIESEGHLESPNYPEDYQPDKECVWKITIPKDHQIALRFQSIDIENHDNCAYDYVEIKDGLSPNSPILKRFCGHKIPADVISSSNQLLVKFVSDGSVQKQGFSAVIIKEYDECNKIDHGCAQQCINTLGSYICTCKIGYELHSDGKHCEDTCGGIFNEPNGTITSPSFPDLYPLNKSCVWEIVAPPQFRITINFTHFELEGNAYNQQLQCEYDKVEIYSKLKNEKFKKHGSYCGPKPPPPITSEENIMRIVFNSDTSIQKSGFAAVFFTDMDECSDNQGSCEHECINTLGAYICTCHNGYILAENERDCKESGCKYEVSDPYGTLASPNYPNDYPPRIDCVWHFTTTAGHRIRIAFQQFDLEPCEECFNDRVDFYDGLSSESPSLGRFCGSKLPHSIMSSGNQLYMTFKSDSSVQKNGFWATHSTVCGGTLEATSEKRHVYSHSKFGNYTYENRVDCDWTIEAREGYNVKLSFLTFDIEDEKDCGCDYVEIIGGLDSSGPSYGKYCGYKKPFHIISAHEALLVTFRTDDTLVYKGFSLLYEAVEVDQSKAEI